MNTRLQWMLMNADGSGVAPLTNDREPHFQLPACQDGKHVVYATWRNGTQELWRADSDGSNPVKFQTGMLIGGALCTPDSKGVVYASDNALMRIPMEGGLPEKLNFPLTQIAFSPNGKMAVYASEVVAGGSLKARLIVAQAGGGAPLHTFEVPYGMRSLQFTPDSKAIAYLLTRNRAGNIWEQPLAGGEPLQLTKFPSGEMFAFAWSKDGKQLAFSRGQRKTDVVMMNNFH